MTFAADGRVVSGESFDLRVPGSEGRIRLAFEQIAVGGRRFGALARLRNDTDRRLLGLALRLPGAERVGFDELAAGRDSTGRPVEGLIPEPGGAGLATMLGILAGVAEAGGFDVEGAETISGLETDAAGNLLVFTPDAKAPVRLGPDGAAATRTSRSAPMGPVFAAGERPRRRDADGTEWRVVEAQPGLVVERRDDAGKLLLRFPLPPGPSPVALALGRDRRLLYVAREHGGREGPAVLVYRVL